MTDGPRLKLSQDLFDELVEHARADAPDECCGMIAAREGVATRVLRATNAAHSPVRYELDPREQLQLFDALDEAGEDLGAIYHSHTRSEPYPSQTDINLAFYPETLYVIVGVAGDQADVRAFRIVDNTVDEVGLEVTGPA